MYENQWINVKEKSFEVFSASCKTLSFAHTRFWKDSDERTFRHVLGANCKLAPQFQFLRHGHSYIRSETDLMIATHLVLVVLFLVGATSPKRLRFRPFKSDRDEIWQDCCSSKYASTDGGQYLISRHALKMAAMTSFHARKCCHLASAHTASVHEA